MSNVMNTFNTSIVLFKNDREEIKKAIQCVLNTKHLSTLFLIDNSPTDNLKNLSNDCRVEYIFNSKNIGFGAAHNISLKKSIHSGAKYHLIMNPDISFDENALESIRNYMDHNLEVGVLMPKILSYDGQKQYLPKLLPSPWNLLIRKIPLPSFFKHKLLCKYELRLLPDDKPSQVAIISGCFAFFRIETLKTIGFFDEKYFMYFEDFDISRRSIKHGYNMFYPEVSIYHGYDSGANKKFHLTKIFLKSAFTYFNKWGWFFDRDRIAINENVIKLLNKIRKSSIL